MKCPGTLEPPGYNTACTLLGYEWSRFSVSVLGKKRGGREGGREGEREKVFWAVM